MAPPRPHWEHFHHGADIGIRGIGASLEQAFAAAGEALTAVVTDPGCIRKVETVMIEVDDEDRELLFVRYLNAIIFEMSVRRMLFREFDVHISDGRLTATLHGERVDVQRHTPAVEIKGATLTELRIAPYEEGWCAQCIVDV